MRGLTLAVLVPGLFLLGACSPNPTVQGRKLSEWVKQLDDRDEATQESALNVIKKLGAPSDKVEVYPHDVERARGPLTRLASDQSSSSSVRGKAATLRYGIFGITPANESVNDLFSLIGNKDYEYFWDASAGRALASMRTIKDQILVRAADKLQLHQDELLGLEEIFAAFGDDALKVLEGIPVTPGDYTLNRDIEAAKKAAKCGKNIRYA